MSTSLRSTKWSRYTLDNQDNPLWKAQKWGSTAEMLIAALADPDIDKDSKKRASEILAWIGEFKKSHDCEVTSFLLELYTPYDPWDTDYQLCEVTRDGKTTKEWVRVRELPPYKLSTTQSAAQGTAPEDADTEI